jgi:hypothetical protein
MKKVAIFALLIAAVFATPVCAQVRKPVDIANDLRRLADEVAALPPPVTTVAAGGNLQAALDSGDTIQLAAGAVYTGNYKVRSGTTLIGNGAKLVGVGGPALYLPPGTSNVYVSNIEAGSSWDQSIIKIGDNTATTQGTPDKQPIHITLDHISIQTFRGKRGIEVHAADVRVTNSYIVDVYSAGALDSQAIWIGNASCNPCILTGNTLSAGSENVFVGGDTVKMLNPDGSRVVPKNILVERNNIFKPLSWQTDGVNRGVKNLIELKNGTGVVIRNNTLDGSWRAAQDGYCIVVTPRAWGTVADVLVEGNTCTHVGGGFNILGADGSTYTPTLTGLVIRNNRLTIDHLTYGGRGILALLTGAPHDVTLDSNLVTFTGNCVVYIDLPHSRMSPDGVTLVPIAPMASFSLTGNLTTAGTYGVITGHANTGTAPEVGVVDVLTVTGNTFADANSWMKKYFPSNTFVTRADLDALIVK